MAHNRSVLKERRIPLGALDCFAVAECRGWRWGSVPRRGSAGSVLHSQVGSGEDELSRCCARVFAVCLQGSLRTDPAPLGVFGGSAGSVLHSQVGSGEEGLSRCARGSLLFASKARSGPVPLPLGVGVMLGEMVVLSRGWGSARPGLRSQGSSEDRNFARCAKGGVWACGGGMGK